MLSIIIQFLLLSGHLVFPVEYSVVFGRQGEDCMGRGICSFSKTNDPANSNASLVFNAADTTLRMALQQNRFSASQIDYQFGRQQVKTASPSAPVFVMDKDFFFSDAIKSSLGLPVTLNKIVQGNYEITAVTAEQILVKFKLQ